MPEVRLYHSVRKCAKFARRLGIEFTMFDNCDAQTWMFDDGKGGCAVVYYGGDEKTDRISDISMLAHEATHIALYAFDAIHDERPSEEALCYTVQAITGILCAMHFKWKEKRSAKHRD